MNSIKVIADDIFEEDFQIVRNSRNKNRKNEICGKVIKRTACNTKISTREIVDLALGYHKWKDNCVDPKSGVSSMSQVSLPNS